VLAPTGATTPPKKNGGSPYRRPSGGVATLVDEGEAAEGLTGAHAPGARRRVGGGRPRRRPHLRRHVPRPRS